VVVLHRGGAAGRAVLSRVNYLATNGRLSVWSPTFITCGRAPRDGEGGKAHPRVEVLREISCELADPAVENQRGATTHTAELYVAVSS
jgi:hypothetical protein